MIFAEAVIITFAILFGKSGLINCAMYEFILANDDIFEPCPQTPNNNGIHDFFDLSELVIEYADGKINAHGNVTALWDIKPTDRVQFRGDAYKFQRGTWQLTPYTIVVTDFCQQFFIPGTYWHSVWTHAIHETDRVCINHKGHTYHHYPFSADTTIKMGHNIEGRYKLVITFEAFDKNNVKKPSIVCAEIPGEIVKL